MKRKNVAAWTERDDEVLRREWDNLSCRLLGERLGRSAGAVSRRGGELGLPKKKSRTVKVRVRGYDRQLTIRQSIDRIFGRKS